MNLLPGHTAIYPWEGRIEEAPEASFIAKTTEAGFEALRARIRALHSYGLPCIVALPVAAGDGGYLDWVRAQVAGRSGLRAE